MPRGGKRPGAGRKPNNDATTPTQKRRLISDIAREFTEVAVRSLVEIARSGGSESARVAAANALLDRAYGKPPQHLDNDVTANGDFAQALLAARRRAARGDQ